MTRARVDHDFCAGTAMCVSIAPGAFQLDDDGLSVFQPAGGYTREDLEEAVDSCPMAAIALLDEDATQPSGPA